MMRIPRGVMVVDGFPSREWREALARAGADAGLHGFPRDELAPSMGPGWRNWFRGIARVAKVEVPRGPVADASGRVTPEWRRWFERV